MFLLEIKLPPAAVLVPEGLMTEKILEVFDVVKNFSVRGGILGREVGRVHALRSVSLSIGRGETLGVVGESGCGKSTLGMLVLRLLDADSGKIFFDGKEITKLSQRKMRPVRRSMQVVFQDPYASLNPRMKIGSIVAEPISVHEKISKSQLRERVSELLSVVGLHADDSEKYPHEFSGGQRQRIGIARAIALRPKLIIADEPVSALDVSIRGEILNLFAELRQRLGLAYLFISHDLRVIEHISDRVAVMYLGKVVEVLSSGSTAEAAHPYTQALIASAPTLDPNLARKKPVLTGDVPSPLNPPEGCSFHTRCPFARDLCRQKEPQLRQFGTTSQVACHYAEEIKKLSL